MPGTRVSRPGLIRRLTVTLLLTGCARIAPPPGGPPDAAPPQLIATFPESVTALEGFDDWVTFRFDEVIDEGGQPNFGDGTGGLEKLVFLSPDTLVPRISWRRQTIAVRPQHDWIPNTTYRIELAPGIRDLRGNTLSRGEVVTFTTGGTLPTTMLTGRAVDWISRRFVPAALVEALTPDSLSYRTLADSTGRFVLGPLPVGEWLVRVSNDANRNRRRDGREAWDTVRVVAGQDSVGELWLFERDTLPPRPTGATAATRVDSFTIAITLSQPIEPTLSLGPDAVAVRMLPDSQSLGAITALPAAQHDTVYRAADQARQAAAAPVDSVPPPPERVIAPPRLGARPGARAGTPVDTSDRPRQTRPALGNRLMVRVTQPLESGRRYLIDVVGVRAAGGAVGDITVVLGVPEARPVPVADTSAVPPDSLPAQSDTSATGRP